LRLRITQTAEDDQAFFKMTLDSNRPIRPKDRFLVFGAPAIEDAEIQEVVATLKSGWLRTGEFSRLQKAWDGKQFVVSAVACHSH
jgi:hypothetical protein